MSDRLNATVPKRVHVLLAEDHAQLRQFIEMVLVGAGFQVTLVESADQAQELLEAGTKADALLSDIRMPGSIDGVQLAQWVQKHRPTMTIILQTGFSDIKTCEFTLLHKPYSPDELFAALYEKIPSRQTN